MGGNAAKAKTYPWGLTADQTIMRLKAELDLAWAELIRVVEERDVAYGQAKGAPK